VSASRLCLAKELNSHDAAEPHRGSCGPRRARVRRVAIRHSSKQQVQECAVSAAAAGGKQRHGTASVSSSRRTASEAKALSQFVGPPRQALVGQLSRRLEPAAPNHYLRGAVSDCCAPARATGSTRHSASTALLDASLKRRRAAAGRLGRVRPLSMMLRAAKFLRHRAGSFARLAARLHCGGTP
jgi:hypothetical protein